MGLLWLLTIGFGCGEAGGDGTEAAVVCAGSISELKDLCPAGTSPVLNAKAAELEEKCRNGDATDETGSVEGACVNTGECLVYCELFISCDCGAERISASEIACKIGCPGGAGGQR